MSRADRERVRLVPMLERMRGCVAALEAALRCDGPISADAGHAIVGTAVEIATTIAKHDAYLLAEAGGVEPEPVQGEVVAADRRKRGERG